MTIILVFKNRPWELAFKKVSREANQAADFTAALHSRDHTLCNRFEQPPQGIHAILRSNARATSPERRSHA
ncbi:hypothetical protein PVK06_015942 [Gossypium arboreum]|uniref:RNase H type-1 domain-containing protein n=1 Tax=Gossypium arboreum TaxID=29729 RepID=A0ABR0PZC3_GOSAR|nr:hypothetical protein PVK06_015942 [Gossypium arboreum]